MSDEADRVSAPAESVEQWEHIARLAAEVANAPMLVGVRPNGTWFGHCDRIEIDAEGPAQAVYEVVREAQRNADGRARQAVAEAKSSEQQAADLADTVALIDRHFGGADHA